MKSIVTILLTVLALTGCAAKITAANERMVMVNAGSVDGAGALSLADSECKKYGRYAVLTSKPREDRQWSFECIK